MEISINSQNKILKQKLDDLKVLGKVSDNKNVSLFNNIQENNNIDYSEIEEKIQNEISNNGYLKGAETKTILSPNAFSDEKFDIGPIVEKVIAEIKSESSDISNQGYLKDAREETVSSKPTEEQQSVIDDYVQRAIDKYPGEVQDSVAYKDENGNLLKEVLTKKGEDGKPYSVTIEYDDQGRVSSINAQCDAPGQTNGKLTTFEYNEDGSIGIKQDSGVSLDGVRASNMVYTEPQVLNPDGTMTNKKGQTHQGLIL